MDATLHVIATPIGNRDDLSARACELLGRVDIVASEDTRRTGRLLSHFGIAARQLSLHEHNEAEVVARVLAELAAGRSVALVCDAGTPLVSDPGYRLVRGAHAAGIRVSPVPGPAAVIAALSVAGLATDRFAFEGFLPPKRAARKARLEGLRHESRTLVIYEAVHRIHETLADAAAAFGAGRDAFVGRELTKLHEQCVQAPLGELCHMLSDGRIARKGEFVLVVAGADERDEPATLDADRLLEELAAVLPGRQAAAIVARVSGRPRNEVYRRMLDIGGDD